VTAKLAVSLYGRATETVQEAARLQDILVKEEDGGTASVMWPTPEGSSQLVAPLDVVQGLVAKLERMNLGMHEPLRSKVDLLTSHESGDGDPSEYYSWTFHESADLSRNLEPSAPQVSLMETSSEMDSGAEGRPRGVNIAAPSTTL